ncbi:MAG: hypothetical protein KA807_04050 [Prolixibacteraceae bacterium]|jgi:hypothetical protein|nr:hypothetical protein [Prolixibacteraceae bacterium]
MTPSILFAATQHGSFNLIYPLLEKCLQKYDVGYIGIKKIVHDNLLLNRTIKSEYEDIDVLALDVFDLFLTGTSPTSEIEYNMWKYAKSKGKRSISVLDSSKYAADRFCKRGIMCFPDIICVADHQVKETLQTIVSEKSIIAVTGSPYFDDIDRFKISDAERLYIRAKRGISNKKLIMFCTEYIAKMDEKERYGFDEISILNDLIRYIDIRGKDRFRLAIRLHPNDSREIYESYMNSMGHDIEWEIIIEDADRKLFQLSDVIVGMTSLILVDAVILGIPSISYQPTNVIIEIMEFRSMANIELAATREELFSFMDNVLLNDGFKKSDRHMYLYANSVEKIMGIIESSVFECNKEVY